MLLSSIFALVQAGKLQKLLKLKNWIKEEERRKAQNVSKQVLNTHKQRSGKIPKNSRNIVEDCWGSVHVVTMTSLNSSRLKGKYPII